MSRRLSLTAWMAAAIFAPVSLAAADGPPLTQETIARDWNDWIGMSPDSIRWAPDGKAIHFEWNPDHADAASTYAIAPAGGTARRLTPEEVRLIPPSPVRGSHAFSALDFSADGQKVVYQRQGDIFLVEVPSGAVKRITTTDAGEQNPRFTHDAKAVTFETSNNLFAYTLATGELVQLTNFRTGKPPAGLSDTDKALEAEQFELFDYIKKTDRMAKESADRNRRERGPRPSVTWLADAQAVTDMHLAPGGKLAIFTLVDNSRMPRVLDYPEYVTKSGYVEIRHTVGDAPPTKVAAPFREYRLGAVSLPDGKVRYVDAAGFGKPVTWNEVEWSPDGQRAVAWVGSIDHKDLWLTLVDFDSATAKVLHHEHDEAWVRGFRAGRLQRGDGFAGGFLPDSRTVWFLSEKDGWYHLYTVGTDGGEVKALTSGPFELTKPMLTRDGKGWLFLSSEGDLAQRHLYSMPLAGGARTRLTPGEGWYDDYELSPDGRTVAITFEDPSTPPELYVMEVQAGAKPQRLTLSTTEEFRKHRWTKPEYVTFPDQKGWTVHADVIRPTRPDPLKPAIIHVHGAGWAHCVQKRFSGCLPDTRLQAQYFADHGYTVMNVDYKASRGYGRESRTAIYHNLGVAELESLDAAVEYLVSHYGIDRKRIGLYGHSQGAYVTLMAALTRPGLFAALAAQAPPTDNAHAPVWHWMTRVLGTPLDNREGYEKSSPIFYADKLRDRLLIFHGIVDTNVPIQESFRLAQRFIELKKTGWDLVVYPVEPHLPRQETSRLDIERRRFALFESVLKAPSVRAAAAGR